MESAKGCAQRETAPIIRSREGLTDGWAHEECDMRSDELSAADGYSLAIADEMSKFLRAVYGWMSAGLAITAATAWAVAASPRAIEVLAANRLLFWGLFLGQLGIVFVLSARVQQLAASTAAVLFI